MGTVLEGVGHGDCTGGVGHGDCTGGSKAWGLYWRE